MPRDLEAYTLVQAKAKAVLERLGSTLSSSSTERSIIQSCIDLLHEQGIHETWYYDVPALVLLGSRSCLSVSGRDYVPADEAAGERNLVTVDLSPVLGGRWGDCARSFVLEDGRVTAHPRTPEFAQGLATQRALHGRLMTMTPDRTLASVAEELNALITRLGYENLDFLGNLGHSIASRREDRIYLEPGNTTRLDEVGYFTFEPHIRRVGGLWGYKHEDIYYFEAGTIRVL